jgi:hypothetical protein
MTAEIRHKPLPPRTVFLRRIGRNALIALGLVGGSLLVGMLGYRGFEGMGWVDAFLNASMILGGMGPVSPLQTVGGKVFAGCYALFSGVVFITAAAVLLAPVLHRFLHRFHLDITP